MKKMMDSERFKKMVCCAMKISRKPEKHNKDIEKHSLITANQLISDDSSHKKKKRQVTHVPRGFMAVYVGLSHRRFIIPTKILSVPEFKELMDKAAEEYGYEQQGGLSIPCDEDDFKELLLTCKLYSKTNKCMSYNVHAHHHHSCITPPIHV